MKKYFIFLILLLVACNLNPKWENKSFINNNNIEIYSFKKNINNLELTYTFKENEIELLNIKNNLYIYSISKLIFKDEITFECAKGKSDYKDSNDLIDINDNDFIAEVESFNIKDKLIKQNDEISKKVVYFLDEFFYAKK